MLKRPVTIAIRLVLGSALLAATAVFAQPSLVAEGAAPAVKVTVYCYSAKERTVVKNQSSKTVTIIRVGSLYKPYSNEPFRVTRKLAPGKSITFYTGSGASKSNSKTLTRRSIYNNEVGTREGARVKTSTGKKYIDRC